MSDPVSQRPQPLPESARARLGRAQAGKPFFTSDLSVNEIVLTTQTGFQPLGLVMGTCIYHVGIQQSRWSVSQELQVLSQAMYQCRELAMARMESEADALGADGVIGVRIRSLNYAFASDVLEFVAVGTAVRATDGQSYRTAKGRWVLHRWSQWQGSEPTYEFITDEAAKQWLTINNDDAVIAKYFGDLEDESGPAPIGRPEIGPAVNIRLGNLLPVVDQRAADEGVTRAEMIRRLVAAGIAGQPTTAHRA